MRIAGVDGILQIVGGSQRQATIQGERDDLMGWRCYSVSYDIPKFPLWADVYELKVLLDSGAFSRSRWDRLSSQTVLGMQMRWEMRVQQYHDLPHFQVHALASNDLLIDETWVGDNKYKRRWSEKDAELAVRETVAAARYLASQRQYLAPRRLVLGCQGVTAEQYRRCVEQVLEVAAPEDWIGLGGWCILGRMPSYLPVFYEVLHQCIPLIAQAGVRHVHIYGCFLEKALAPLLWMCDRASADSSVRAGLTVSADSNRGWKDLTRKDLKRSGAKRPYWRDNVAWWTHHLENLRTSKFYRIPPRYHHQLNLFDSGGFKCDELLA